MFGGYLAQLGSSLVPKQRSAWCLFLWVLWVHVCPELLSTALSEFPSPVPGDTEDRTDTKGAYICLDVLESPAY